MNKQEYLERLEACLKHKLSRDEIEDIMRIGSGLFVLFTQNILKKAEDKASRIRRFLQNWEIRNWWLSS